MSGTIKWFNAEKGYGFITANGVNEDIFLHFSQLNMDGYKTIEENTSVSFDLFTDERGKLQAKNVCVVQLP